MSDAAIVAEAVGKRYRLGTDLNANLSERLERAVRAPVRMLRSRAASEGAASRAQEPDEIWAIRDASFELHSGEALGLIGRNGAGKSTLLKLLTGISLPTEGRIRLRGRVATLLEVGTGFHPELTGRENIFLNGTILGMRRKEVMARYAEIVEFSGIERFLETPVKRYSSGMYVRLAFAVAAHLDPEIMLVDEVLAVGDGEFQRKCLGKMREVADEEGRAVVFVSHNLNAVQRLCSRALLIEQGRIVLDDTPERTTAAYLERTGPELVEGVAEILDSAERNGTGEARLRRVTLRDSRGQPTTSIHMGEPFAVSAVYEVFEPISSAAFELGIQTLEGDQVLTSQTIDAGGHPIDIPPGVHEITVSVETTLLPHEFALGLALHRTDGNTVDHVNGAHRFTALNAALDGEDHYPWHSVRGYSRPAAAWQPLREGMPEEASPAIP